MLSRLSCHKGTLEHSLSTKNPDNYLFVSVTIDNESEKLSSLSAKVHETALLKTCKKTQQEIDHCTNWANLA